MKRTELWNRWTALLLALCLVFALSACGGGESAPEAAPDAAGRTDGASISEAAADGGETGLSVAADTAAAGSAARMSAGDSDGLPATGDDTVPATPAQQGEAFVLTAAEWNDNENWPFFTNLVNTEAISFPSFGIDPRNRIKVTVADEGGTPLSRETVTLLDAGGNPLWTAQTDKTGTAYLFSAAGQTPAEVSVNGVSRPVSSVERPDGDQQGASVMRASDEIAVTVAPKAAAAKALQVMFIVDTTGSMGDELTYLQKDFSSIAQQVGTDGISYSVNFYRDQGADEAYVTKCNDFTSDVKQVQDLLSAEYADGGGDTPEAVAEILQETLTKNTGWQADCNKVAFLIFDAPPHEGKEAVLLEAVKKAAAEGIRLVPVVASNAERETELFGRALSICTGGTYLFLTDDSGVGDSHLEPIVGDYKVELLHDLIVRVINGYKPG